MSYNELNETIEESEEKMLLRKVSSLLASNGVKAEEIIIKGKYAQFTANNTYYVTSFNLDINSPFLYDINEFKTKEESDLFLSSLYVPKKLKPLVFEHTRKNHFCFNTFVGF